MSVMDEDHNAVFMKMMEGIELEEPTDAINYSTLDDKTLAIAWEETRTRLHEIGEMYTLNPRGEAADLHSRFSAINVEMRRRWPTQEISKEDQP